MGSIQLKHESVNSGTAVTVHCNTVRASGKKNNVKQPNANMDGTIVQGQSQSIENPTYVLSNVLFNGGSGTLSYTDVLILYRASFSGSNPIYLKVISGSSTQLPDSQGTTLTDGIPVLLESFDIVHNHMSSSEGEIPTVTLTFVETKTS